MNSLLATHEVYRPTNKADKNTAKLAIESQSIPAIQAWLISVLKW